MKNLNIVQKEPSIIPSISVVMSVYNENPTYLKESVYSILRQSFTDFEFIIVDDASDECIEKFINNFEDNRIVFIRNEQNLGLTKSLIKAISYCKADLIARMDSDDIALHNRLFLQYTYMKKYPKVGVLGSRASVLKKKVFGVNFHNPLNHEAIKARMIFQNPMVHSSVIIRRDILEKFNYNGDIRLAQDYELWSRLVWVTEFANLHKKLVRYRVHNSQISNRKKDEQDNIARSVRLSMLKRIEMMDPKNIDMILDSCENRVFKINHIVALRKLNAEILRRNRKCPHYSYIKLKKELNKNYDRMIYIYLKKTSRWNFFKLFRYLNFHISLYKLRIIIYMLLGR